MNRKDLKITIVGFTLLALPAFSYTQYRTYNDDIRTNKEQLQLNTLHGKIVYLDEALTMSARSYVITKDTQWLRRYGGFSLSLMGHHTDLQAHAHLLRR